MSVFNHNISHSKAYLVLFLLIGLSVSANAQAPVSKGNTHIIDKSKLTIHQNYRDEQPQHFDNSRSRIVASAGNSHTRTKSQAFKKTTLHPKTPTGTQKKGAYINHANKVHHKINRKVRKTH